MIYRMAWTEGFCERPEGKEVAGEGSGKKKVRKSCLFRALYSVPPLHVNEEDHLTA